MNFKNLRYVLVLAQMVVCSAVFSDSAEFKPWYSEEKISENGLFLVTLEAGQSEVLLNTYHTWVLTVVDAQSKKPVSPLRLVVDGGMPLHGHGLPSQPQAGTHLGDGRYEVEGVQFNMNGNWVLMFGLSTKIGTDQVKFELLVDY